MKHNKIKGFTLVELVVVIAILAILATVWFVSYSSYIVWARDWNRVSQLATIHDWLDVYRTGNDLPLPENKVEVRLSWSVIWYQWYVWKNILETIKYNKWWIDPKDETYFSYYITKDWKDFQLMAFLEDWANKQVVRSLFNNTYAIDYTNRYPTFYGSKLWILTQPTTNIPIQEIPSISTAWYIDIFTNTGTYTANFTDNDSVTASWVLLSSAVYNRNRTECIEWMADLMLTNWQTWSCINLWATTVWDWVTQPTNCWWSPNNCNLGLSWLWDYYQWWRNDTWFTNWTWSAPYNYGWEAQNDGKWWWSTSDTWTLDWAWTTAIWRQWPCPNWWHVPSVADWQLACNNITWTTCTNWMAYNSLILSKLKIPLAGYRNWSNWAYTDEFWNASYWSSSPISFVSYGFHFSNSVIDKSVNTNRSYWISIRCIKN